jgi:hypothetical protein
VGEEEEEEAGPMVQVPTRINVAKNGARGEREDDETFIKDYLCDVAERQQENKNKNKNKNTKGNKRRLLL